MSERTDERTDSAGDVDVEDLLDDRGGDATADGSLGGDTGDDPLADEDDLGVDVEALTGDPDAGRTTRDPTAAEAEGRGLLSRLRPSSLPNPLAGLPSGRSLLLTFGVVLVSVLLAGSVPLLGGIGGALGIFAGAFVLGLISGKQRYVEFALAGAVVSGLGALQGSLFRVALLSDVGLAPFVAVGGSVGLVVALLGHYFGRDLRDGLTANID